MERLNIPFGAMEGPDWKAALIEISQRGEGLTPQVIQILKSLWSDTGVQICFSRSSEYQLHDSAK